MRRLQSTISCANVCQVAVRWLSHTLHWVSGGALAPDLLIQLLVRAAAEMRSLSAIVAQATAAPCWQTVRTRLLACLPADPLDLLPTTTHALQHRLPKSLKKRPRTLAIDLHLRPYYGAPGTPGTYRGQPKAGTKTFFAYASLLVLRRGQRFSVGLTPVVNGQEQTDLLERLLGQAQRAGLTVRCLLLDRGFYAATTIAWLQERGLAFLMPMIRRGRGGRRKADCTGTQRFFVRGRRGWDSYTWTTRPRRGGRKGAAVTVTVAVCMVPRSRCGGRRGKKHRGPLVFACHGVRGTPATVASCYRRRFGIETSYRQLGEGLAATCSTQAAYRLLLVAIALVLRNVWVWLHWSWLSERTATGRRLRLPLLPLRQLTAWLIRALDRLLGVRTRIAVPGEQGSNDNHGR
jgi:hypothetical protein